MGITTPDMKITPTVARDIALATLKAGYLNEEGLGCTGAVPDRYNDGSIKLPMGINVDDMIAAGLFNDRGFLNLPKLDHIAAGKEKGTR